MDNVTELYRQNADESEVADAISAAIDAAIEGVGRPVSGLAVVGALRLYEHRLLAMACSV